VNPKLPVHSVKELIDFARAHPGKLSFGSSGPSSSLRFAGELLKSMTGIDMIHVPYDGNGPMTLAIMQNEVDLGFVNPVSLPSIKEGRLRALAITSKQRSPNLPDLPTVAESGVPGYEAGSWFGLMAPDHTPKDIIVKLNRAVNEALQMPDVRKRLLAVDAQPSGNSPEEFSAYITSELEKWRVLIQKTGIKIN
jgi:tripartite-type tricarboxylate transporter receptor subunit TctC